jgi:spore germination protein GerM
LRAALVQLFIGVTPSEAEAGLHSAFYSGTADSLRGVTVQDGVATVDLTEGFELTNNFSTTNLSSVVLSQIAATAFALPEVAGVEFRIDGERWCGWESGPCGDVPAPFLVRQ